MKENRKKSYRKVGEDSEGKQKEKLQKSRRG